MLKLSHCNIIVQQHFPAGKDLSSKVTEITGNAHVHTVNIGR